MRRQFLLVLALISFALPTAAQVADRDSWTWVSPKFYQLPTTPADVRACLDAGRDSNARNDSKRTQLHLTAFNGDDPAMVNSSGTWAGHIPYYRHSNPMLVDNGSDGVLN